MEKTILGIREDYSTDKRIIELNRLVGSDNWAYGYPSIPFNNTIAEQLVATLTQYELTTNELYNFVQSYELLPGDMDWDSALCQEFKGQTTNQHGEL
jgi:hypothetical protein